MRKNFFSSTFFKRGAALLSSIILSAGCFNAQAIISTAKTVGYVNELTGLPTTEKPLQRPIAVMIYNDKRANPHYVLGEADIVYEMVNSTANKRVTRLMAIYKDYNTISRIGNIRSTRPTNIMLAAEYNAVLIHDGGPYYNNSHFKRSKIDHISGGFSRIKNGKKSEFTEYVTTGQVKRKMAAAKISPNYTFLAGNHFNFGVNNLAARADSYSALNAYLPFPHNSTQFHYDASKNLYNFKELGKLVKGGDDNQSDAFTILIILNCPMVKLDKKGYVIYNIISQNRPGYYISGGRMIPIAWSKTGDATKMTFSTLDGKELIVNPGKTYIGIVPEDSWNKVFIG